MRYLLRQKFPSSQRFQKDDHETSSTEPKSKVRYASVENGISGLNHISKVGAFSEKGARAPLTRFPTSPPLHQAGTYIALWQGALTKRRGEGSLFPKASGDHNKERCDFRSEQRRTKRPPRDVSGQQPVACIYMYVCMCVCVCMRAMIEGLLSPSLFFSLLERRLIYTGRRCRFLE